MFPFTRVPFWVPFFDPHPCLSGFKDLGLYLFLGVPFVGWALEGNHRTSTTFGWVSSQKDRAIWVAHEAGREVPTLLC